MADITVVTVENYLRILRLLSTLRLKWFSTVTVNFDRS